MGDNATTEDWKNRKRAQRSVSLKGRSCSKCGKKSGLQRHHTRLDHSTRVKLLCQSCHTKADIKSGKWGTSGKKKKASISLLGLLGSSIID